MRDAIEIRFGGLGGQGVLLMGAMLGQAGVRHGYWAAGSNSYGVQARGGSCRSDVILAGEAADYPHVTRPDLLVVMSQGAYAEYLPALHAQGLIVVDQPPVSAAEGDTRLHVAVPATATAVEQLGSRQVANMVLLAATVSLTRLVPEEVFLAAVDAGVDPRFRETNHKALDVGFTLGREARAAAGEKLSPWGARLGLSI